MTKVRGICSTDIIDTADVSAAMTSRNTNTIQRHVHGQNTREQLEEKRKGRDGAGDWSGEVDADGILQAIFECTALGRSVNNWQGCGSWAATRLPWLPRRRRRTLLPRRAGRREAGN